LKKDDHKEKGWGEKGGKKQFKKEEQKFVKTISV